MIDTLAVYGVLAVAFIMASIIGKIVYKRVRRRVREERRVRAGGDNECITAFYRELILKQIWGDIK